MLRRPQAMVFWAEGGHADRFEAGVHRGEPLVPSRHGLGTLLRVIGFPVVGQVQSKLNELRRERLEAAHEFQQSDQTGVRASLVRLVMIQLLQNVEEGPANGLRQ